MQRPMLENIMGNMHAVWVAIRNSAGQNEV